MEEQPTSEQRGEEALAATAEHDTWFRSEVEKAIRNADSPHAHWTDHNVVKQILARKRAELLEATGSKLEVDDHRMGWMMRLLIDSISWITSPATIRKQRYGWTRVSIS